ncbi:magnesium transporter CorA family protein [Phyllobacterium sp. 0TCS1.6C]|jgi:magnesium transporter|uniref:magnesium transporter CorA family protein n=1 Tax=unclassified Phyllobacterium TaxID=2638441 RepID=UPI0022641E89|nr:MULTISPECIES: magnesium transporter CorA family protein [unclassified Phyllobacterium]MCX8281318.1 magnesium transporter CorA family protein [Phyllobacterium sp. 0TCS1.6C]MCX8296026.1 magnesium transporter CorA family protein [Phyllobacterium sp. 0TCS1.6A]
MITIYTLDKDRLVAQAAKAGDPLPDGTVWIDLLHPTREEDLQTEEWTKAAIPTHEDMVEIEESSRFYSEAGSQYLTASILYAGENNHHSIAPISFILAGKFLVTVRYSEPRAFTLYTSRATKSGNGLVSENCSGVTILLGIIEAVTDRIADILEGVASEIDHNSAMIFRRSEKDRPMTTKNFRDSLTRIGGQGAFLSKIRESTAGVSRLLVYMTAITDQNSYKKETRAWIKSLERDTQSLSTYVDFLSNKITFLLDTVVGLISIEQNAIIKIFSVAAVAFMPPTLVASIYGMNFQFMPELSQVWGYPMALGLMVASAVIPLLIFKKKGWL